MKRTYVPWNPHGKTRASETWDSVVENCLREDED